MILVFSPIQMLPYFRSMEAFFNLSLPKERLSLSDRQHLFDLYWITWQFENQKKMEKERKYYTNEEKLSLVRRIFFWPFVFDAKGF